MKGNEQFGISGYQLAATCALDQPQTFKIHDGKRQTYIDDAVKVKAFVPPAQYTVTGNLVTKGHKSMLNKAERRTLADEIATFEKKNPIPAPNAFNPSHSMVFKKNSACMNFKGEKVSYLSDAQWRGANSAEYH